MFGLHNNETNLLVALIWSKEYTYKYKNTTIKWNTWTNTSDSKRYTHYDHNENDTRQVMNDTLATCMYATRCAFNATMQTSPGALVYQWDMLMDVPLIENLEQIRDIRQLLTNREEFNTFKPLG